MTASTVECWVNPNVVKLDEHQRWEPRFFWARRNQTVYLSEVKHFPLPDLYELRPDAWSECDELNGSIETNRAYLSGMAKDQPMAARQLNREIKMMLVKRKAVKMIFFEADRLIKQANAQANKPKKKDKIITNRKDLELHDQICRQMKYFKTQVMYELLRDQMGCAAIEALEMSCVEPAIQRLIAWGEKDMPAKLIEHEAESQRRELAAKSKRLTNKGA